MKLKNFLWPLFLALALAIGVFIGGNLSFFNRPLDSFQNKGRVKLNKLIDLIEKEYVDDVNTDSIIDLTVNNILAQLDPHSVYIAKSEMDEVQESMKGSFVGIGINYYNYNDTLTVIKPVFGGPSYKAGLKNGDRILYANDIKLFGRNIKNDSLVSILKGDSGSKVTLKVFRKNENKLFSVVVTRGDIPLKSVDVGLMLNDKVGFIKINRFSETTYAEFKTALDDLVKKGVTELILDLRENGGGYMDQAIQIADEFLAKDDVIVKTINKQGKERITKATEKGVFEKGKLTVLINENSASASEIIAGAIQDNDRGTIVGRRSYGKGLVQREMYLGDGSAVRLTTARYYTPSGRSIQKPYNDGIDEYSNELYSRFESGELYERDSIHLADSLQFKTKAGRIVYGGGGIVPDVFVPIKNRSGEDAIQLLMRTSLVSNFVFEQIDADRSMFEALSSDEIIAKINNNPKYFNNLKKHLANEGLQFNLDKHKKSILFYLTAEYVNQLKQDKDYYEWLLKEDPMLKVIKK